MRSEIYQNLVVNNKWNFYLWDLKKCYIHRYYSKADFSLQNTKNKQKIFDQKNYIKYLQY